MNATPLPPIPSLLREPWRSVYRAAMAIYAHPGDWVSPATRFAAARVATGAMLLEDAESAAGPCPVCGRYPSQPWPHNGFPCGHCDPDDA